MKDEPCTLALGAGHGPLPTLFLAWLGQMGRWVGAIAANLIAAKVLMTDTSQLSETTIPRCSSGIEGLDDILGGGLPAGRVYLLEGEPGTGKTTVALQFVADGLRKKEKVLYVTLSESRDELLQVAKIHGIPVDGVHFL